MNTPKITPETLTTAIDSIFNNYFYQGGKDKLIFGIGASFEVKRQWKLVVFDQKIMNLLNANKDTALMKVLVEKNDPRILNVSHVVKVTVFRTEILQLMVNKEIQTQCNLVSLEYNVENFLNRISSTIEESFKLKGVLN